ncbi:P-loop containing nucleoside triphosphate hydrolase protein [Boletus reticuloceps]|uniref:Kinesin-like protein n=1 Tax=Boletus reticuloceps TaxID=495285 RepID=A0A8I3ACL0_9AGAM|nr:P-loop containing nucleoside triphosphate hydrolase protein [Boletus reticuloceps]
MTSHKINIAARLRPRLDNELDDEGIQITHTPGGPSCISVPNPRDLSQTVTIFAYGVTSSGKTHTMQGTKAQPGVIRRVVEAMFLHKAALQRSNVELAVSYMEIYKDDVYDLFVNRESAPKLPVRENDAGQVFVANLSSLPVESVEEFDIIYSLASRHRSVGATNLNRASSRSHAVLTIEVTMTDSATQKTLTGKINLVDLAGSENNKLTGNDPTRMAESAAINKSLSVLGQVVHALNQGASRIPYRNSKLTRILQDALGGSSVGLLICNLAPGIKFRQDTLNTLNFAVRTKNVENRPVVNERDNRPQAKPHFAAIQPPPPKLAPAVLQVDPILASRVVVTTNAAPGPSRRPRPSRVPRISLGPGLLPPLAKTKSRPAAIVEESETTVQLTEVDINERIAKAVEAEVTRRLKEREDREREERTRLEQEKENLALREKQDDERRQAQANSKLPPGVLTPLLARHRDLDGQLRARLAELEEKYERSHKELQLADALSPMSRKKTGRAYVALARAHSEKGDLKVALELYRKAETYVPDNIKLRERVLEIEWAVRNGKEFVPSPKKQRRPRGKKRKVATLNFGLARGREEPSSSSMMVAAAASRQQYAMGGCSMDEGEGEETEGEREVEVSLLGRINEEEYEGSSVAVETPALKRVRSEE